MKRFYLTSIWLLLLSMAFAQTDKTIDLDSITVVGSKSKVDISRMSAVENGFIYSGKKTEVINLTAKDLALSEKYGRQIFAKVPGVFIYDMDGTGNQVNISTRGLDPHRGWEFNIRKDGILTNTDMYGYPASHYNIPMEAVERIELVRGTGSLQYGAQFGGMLNYVSKKPENRPIAFESVNTVGSYGLVSTYNGISGTHKKFRYSAWFNKKHLDGYRKNGDSEYNSEGISLFYDASENLHFKFEWTHSNYVIHLAGPLTDAQFKKDPRSSTRARNYYNPNIHVPSFTMDWQLTPATQVKLTSSAVLGSRNSVMFDKVATIPDTIVTSTLEYNNRQVDIDYYHSYTTELRLLHSYPLLRKTSSLVAGIQYMNNNLNRKQQGVGTTGSDFDLTLVQPGWGRDIYLKTSNVAVFAENRWMLTQKLAVNTGVRMEMGESRLTGETTYYPTEDFPNTLEHSFPLFGVNAEYTFNRRTNVYAGWSQAYRPTILKDIVPASIYEATDKNLEDAYGYNSELGFRGGWHFLKWDITAFHLKYNKRLGTVAQTDNAGNVIIFRTNIGNSYTNGVEAFLQGDFGLSPQASLSIFTSTSYMDARYQDATLRSGNNNVSIDGNKVESVPEWISRTGVTLKHHRFSITALYSYTSESFADAFNAVEPSATGATGLVPSYQLVDLNLSVNLTKNIRLQLNGNNIFDVHYFTKRPQFYPGPGIWPSDGRAFSTTVSVSI